MRRAIAILAAMLVSVPAAAPAAAEVVSVTPQGFEVSRTVAIAASPDAVYAALGRIGSWWNPAHSYSGDPRNMTLDPRAGGCFCETNLANGGSVEHGRVILA